MAYFFCSAGETPALRPTAKEGSPRSFETASKGFHCRDMESRDGLYLVVAEAACRYTSPARFEDDILIRTALAKSTDRVIRYQYEIRRKCGNELLATGATAHVVTGRNHQASRLPGLYREYFSLPPRKTAAWE